MSQDNLLYSALKEVMEGYSDLIKTLKNSSMPIDGGYLNYLEYKHLTGKQALTYYDSIRGEFKTSGEMYKAAYDKNKMRRLEPHLIVRLMEEYAKQFQSP